MELERKEIEGTPSHLTRLNATAMEECELVDLWGIVFAEEAVNYVVLEVYFKG